MQEHICNFTGGMNKDLSPNSYPNTFYFDAKNLRIITDSSDGLSSTSLVSPKGNAVSFTLPTNTTLLGYTVLRDALIILAHDSTSGLSQPDKIYRIDLTQLITAQDITVNNNFYHLVPATNYLIYAANLGFNINYPIRVIGNYENAEVQKIYWVDGLNTLKHLNIVYNSDYNDLTNLSSELLEILPNHTYGTYTLTESIGGHLKAGRIQYSYQLYSISGSETLFAPASNLYNITAYGITDGISFAGSDIETEINKSIQVTITLPAGTDTVFDRIRLVALEYEIYNDVPTIRVVSEQELSTITPSFADIGNTIGTLTLEEFQVIKNDLIPASIESKNNYLFAANIQQEFFDVDELVEDLTGGTSTFFDSRAYRWRYAPIGGLAYDTQQLSEDTDDASVIRTVLGGNAYDLVGGSTSLQLMTDSSWSIAVTIGATAHAALQVPVRTVTAVSSVKDSAPSSILLLLHHPIDGWIESLLLVGITSFNCLTPFSTLSVFGNSFTGTKPSELLHDRTEYDDFAIAYFDYTYNYSYSSGATAYECILNKGNVGSSSPNELIVDGSALEDVPEDHDCINVFNNIDNDVIAENDYKYQYGIVGAPTITDLGGTGLHISYSFISESLKIGEYESIDFDPGAGTVGVPIMYSKSSSPGYQSPQTVINFANNQRDEVYRYGIVFNDLKGRPSFTKWIADIRFPNVSEELDPGVSWDYSFEITQADPVDAATTMWAPTLGIKFTIDWAQIETSYPGFTASISGFQIVRCPRTENDCTIKAQGLILPTHYPTTIAGEIEDANYSTYNITSAFDYESGGSCTATTISSTNSTIHKTLIELISPEIAINKNLIIDKTNDFIEIYGRLNNLSTGGGSYSPGSINYDLYGVTGANVIAYDHTIALRAGWRRTIDDGFLSTPEPRNSAIHVIDSVAYVARGFDDDIDGNNPEMTYKGTTLVVSINSAFANPNSVSHNNTIAALAVHGGEQALYGRYRRSLGYSQYGGATYTERSYNQYIPASEFTVVSTASVNLYSGDVYINPYTFLKLFVDTDAEYADHTGQVIVSFPIESRINTAYLSNSLAEHLKNSATLEAKYYVTERQSIGVSMYPNGYPTTIGDLYRYNSAYSTLDMSKVYSIKPYDFRSTETRDTMITSSEKKYSGEYSDSWLDFKYNNYIELEGEYGAITRIVNNNDKLIAFQPRGVAVLSVLERELVETNNTATLAVGTGGILNRYDYITKNSGTSLYDAVIPTESILYYYDDKNVAIYRIADQLECISDIKGMKSYFEDNSFTSMIGAYDRANREIYFSPGTSYTEDTLLFSGYIDAFEGFFELNDNTNYVNKYITFDKYLLSSVDKNKFYLHNVSSCNKFYDTYKTSSLTLIVNPNKTNVFTLHELEWMTDVTYDGAHLQNVTFDTVQLLNTYQDTEEMELSYRPDLKRRFRKWRMNLLRNQGDKGRLRDSWFKAIFTWEQSNTHKKLIIHPINFIVTPTKLF